MSEQLQLNVLYSGPEIAQKLFHVKATTFRNKRKEYLEHLKQYYIFEERGKKIILLKELKPFETRMEKRQDSTRIKEEEYRQATHKIIADQPLNTGKNIARIMNFNVLSPAKKYNHTEETAAGYIRPVLKEDFIKKMSRWCSIDYGTNQYVPLQDEQFDYLMKLFRGEVDTCREGKKLSQEIMDIIADADAGNISKKEMKEKTADTAWKLYNLRMEQFKKKFGFRPYKTPYWIEKGEEKIG